MYALFSVEYTHCCFRHNDIDIGNRAFPVAAARVWNTLSRSVTSASCLPALKRRLKTELFLRSFPEVAPTASDQLRPPAG